MRGYALQWRRHKKKPCLPNGACPIRPRSRLPRSVAVCWPSIAAMAVPGSAGKTADCCINWTRCVGRLGFLRRGDRLRRPSSVILVVQRWPSDGTPGGTPIHSGSHHGALLPESLVDTSDEAINSMNALNPGGRVSTKYRVGRLVLGSYGVLTP